MKVIALLSGGKDSILALLMAYRYHHEPIVVANISPSVSIQAEDDHEVDSYMYQTVGHEAVEDLVQCLGLPLRRATVEKHRAVDQTLHYTEHYSEQDEVEDLYRLLKSIKEEFPDVQGVTSGAILSNYQRNRVEFVCYRLGLVSIAYLWRRQPREILDMAAAMQVRAILVKTASAGLVPKVLLGKTLEDARPTLEKMEVLYNGHMAGEGGEFESFVLSCPLFMKECLMVKAMREVIVDDNDYSPSGHCILTVERRSQTPTEQLCASELLKRLREGKLNFPSDRMPWLPSSVFFVPPPHLKDVACTNDEVHPLAGEESPQRRFAISSLAILNSLLFPGGVAVQHALCGVEVEEIKKCMQNLLHRVDHRPIYFFFDAPNPSLYERIDEVYRSSVRAIRPPGRTIVSTDDTKKKGDTIVIYMVFPLIENMDVVHNQSISCWAAGACGPYSQAWKMSQKATDDKHSDIDTPVESTYVLVGGMSGVVPFTGRLATMQDILPDILTRESESESAEKEVSDFSSQFAYALANALQYASLFECSLNQGCRMTCIVRKNSYAALIPSLIQWCLPEIDIQNLTIEVLVVANIYCNKDIELFVEWIK